MKSSRPEVDSQVRILLVDQDAGFGRRLVQLLERPCGFRLCGHVGDLAALQAAVAAQNPHLVLADTDASYSGGFHHLCSLAAKGPARYILATTQGCDAVRAEQVLLAGARGLLLKTEPAEEILSAFNTVMRGQIYVSRAVTMPLIKRLLSKPTESARSGVESFTDRELRVFELLGSGLSTREIAARLGLSCKTVENHREKIKHRLGVGSAAALAQCACAWVQRGIRTVSPESKEIGRAGRPVTPSPKVDSLR